jgi:4-hydroxybenzoate polyprenyltransferase
MQTATVAWPLLESEPYMFFVDVSLNPSTADLPGSAALQSIANGIASWALIGTLIALLLGAGLWAVGSHTQNAHQSMAGRRAVITALVAAVLIGAAPALINFFFKTGLSVS